MGKTAGTIGETSVIAILIGAIVLLWFEVIDLRIPGSYILSFAVCTLLFGGHGLDFGFLLAELCGGGLMLGAFFMATDYVTSPITKSGQIVYGIALGILTAIFRYLGSAAEGVSYAIIIGNLLVPVIEKVTEPTGFRKRAVLEKGEKGMKEIIKNALILMAITLTAGLALGAVHEITKEPIEAQEKKRRKKPARPFFPRRKALRPGRILMRRQLWSFSRPPVFLRTR